MDALAPFSISNMSQNVEVLPYLKHDDAYNFDIQLAVAIQGQFSLCYIPCNILNYKTV